jgi:hypothetical protein
MRIIGRDFHARQKTLVVLDKVIGGDGHDADRHESGHRHDWRWKPHHRWPIQLGSVHAPTTMHFSR